MLMLSQVSRCLPRKIRDEAEGSALSGLDAKLNPKGYEGAERA
jgi:hypothetical protein